MSGDKEDLINYRISRANETIKEAEAMIEKEFWNASINRMYYACYYIVSGLMLKHELNSTTHKGLRTLLGKHFVLTGLISKEIAKTFSDLYDRRQTGDYDDFILYDRETAETLLPLCKDFVSEIEKLVRTN